MMMEISGNLSDYAVRKRNYNNAYESTYASSKKEAAKKSSNEEYLNDLQKQVPYMKLQIGYGLNTNNDGRVNVLDVSPKLLEKMQNDPKAAKEYIQRLKDIEAATKWLDHYKKSIGHTVIVRHGYVDENGNFSNFSISIRKDELNEKLRREAQENAEKRIEKTREKARENAAQIAEKLEKKAEQLLEEKMTVSKDGTIYLNDTDMKIIIKAAREEDEGKTTVKNQPQAGANLDLKI